MAFKVRADKLAIPRPVVFRIGGSVNTHITASCLDVSFEVVLLLLVQHISCSTEEYYSIVTTEILFIKTIGILSGIDDEVVLLSHLFQGLDAFRDRLVTKRTCLRKHQYPWLSFLFGA